MNNAIQIRLIMDSSEFKTLKALWNPLLKQNYIDDVFLTWEWLSAWWKIYQQGKQLWIVTAWEDSQLVGIAPLMLEKRKIRGLPLKVLGTLGTPSTDVGGFLLKRNEEERILSAIFEYIFINHKQWDLLELSELSLSGPELKGLQNSLPSSGYTCIEEFGYHYYLSLEKDWDSYFDNLSKKFKKNLRRAVRKADELGQITYLFLVGKQIQPEHLETIIKVNSHGNFPIIFNSEKEQAFLYHLYEQMHDCFQVNLLLIDQKAVAYEYGFFYNNRFEAWRAGFDTRVDPTISVGKLLSMRIIEQSYERNYIEIDFLRGNESYKEDWEPLQREYAYIRVLQTRKPVLFLGYILSRIRTTVGSIKNQHKLKFFENKRLNFPLQQSLFSKGNTALTRPRHRMQAELDFQFFDQ